jgi:hypothetical protein
MTRTPAERAMLAILRDDAWRFDRPADREATFKAAIQVSGRFDAFELNVIYEMLMIASTVETLVEHPEEPLSQGMLKHDLARPDPNVAFQLDVMPFAMILAVAGLIEDPNHTEPKPFPTEWRARGLGENDPLSSGVVVAWREWAERIRKSWPQWSTPGGFPTLLALAQSRAARFYGAEFAEAASTVLVGMCETVLRVCWLFECEARDGLAFGPVTERRLPNDEGERATVLRRFCEQQPELRKEPAFVHVAPRDVDAWLRPKDYANLPMLPSDARQTAAIIRDALTNRKYVHDHVAVIEVDRKPIKQIILAPEVMARANGLIFLTALVVHEKGTFACECLIKVAEAEPAHVGYRRHVALSLPFGSHAWRMLPAARGKVGWDDDRRAAASSALPADEHVIALITAAWRDLIVANVREQQYESETVRGGSKNGKRPARSQARGHTRVVRYLPRTVVIRRAMEAARASDPNASSRHLMQAFRVGCFSRMLAVGHKRSPEADDYARAIGMPLTDRQTVVQPHIRGGTEEDRRALLAQDDVRLWRSWAALDLIHARRAGAGEG